MNFFLFELINYSCSGNDKLNDLFLCVCECVEERGLGNKVCRNKGFFDTMVMGDIGMSASFILLCV